jgi:NAD(P)H-nitrite reductase large subunit
MRARSPCHPVIGDEPRLAYNRVLLSSVLAGETAPEDIEFKRFGNVRRQR